MAKYAIVWTTDRGYMPGTNGILNALEHYKFDIDVYVMTWGTELSKEYTDQWPSVSFVPLTTDFWHESKPAKWYLRFADVHFTLNKLWHYDTVLIWGADVCPLNNFTEYFEMAYKMNRVIVGTNEHCRYIDPQFARLNEDWPYIHHWTVPYTDVPLFVPNSHFSVLEKMLEFQRTKGCQLSHMDGLNYAIRDLKTPVWTVPGELWVHNVPSRIPLTRGNNGVVHFDKSNTRMNSFHRRYWAIDLCKKYHPVNETSTRNKLLFNKMWAWFNTEHRVKWGEGWSVWDGT